jgi:hypothetical protein
MKEKDNELTYPHNLQGTSKKSNMDDLLAQRGSQDHRIVHEYLHTLKH